MASLVGVLVLILMTLAAEPAHGGIRLEHVPFASITGWTEEDHAQAFAAFRHSCAEILTAGRAFARPIAFGGTRRLWASLCRKAGAAHDGRRFFERHFMAFAVHDPERPDGLFTGYFEPEAAGSRVADPGYPVAIYRKPDDLVSFNTDAEGATGLRYGRMIAGRPCGFFTRREIEAGALQGRRLELVWLRDWADAFLIHVQGSGRIRFADGSSMRLAYSAKSGQPYTGIGGVLVERGILSKEDMSMQAIRAWMSANPRAARELMWENRSFVFFREIEPADPGLGAPGAQKVQLTPLRSLAVDRSLWAFGTPVWLDTVAPANDGGADEPFRRLMIAQDTGTAIKGAARGDVYWGWGERAALAAGHMKSAGRMIVLLPKALARKFTRQR